MASIKTPYPLLFAKAGRIPVWERNTPIRRRLAGTWLAVRRHRRRSQSGRHVGYLFGAPRDTTTLTFPTGIHKPLYLLIMYSSPFGSTSGTRRRYSSSLGAPAN